MMNLRSIFLATAALAVCVAPLGAQPAHHRHGFMRMLRSLNLSDTQKAQIKNDLQQYRSAHPQGSTPDPQARKELRHELVGILTPAQQEQLKAKLRAKHHKTHQQKELRQSTAPSPPPTPEETAQP